MPEPPALEQRTLAPPAEQRTVAADLRDARVGARDRCRGSVGPSE